MGWHSLQDAWDSVTTTNEMRKTMQEFARKLTGLALGLGIVLVAACGDDDNGNNPSGPSTPTGLVVVANGTDDAAVLTWTASAGATSYLVERSTAPCATYTQLSEVTAATTYTDASIEIDAEYCFRVAAKNADGTSSFSAPVNFSINGPMVATLTTVTTDRTLYSDTLYILSGYVKVSNGATLTIQAGTRIVGDTTAPGSSLWILRGAQIDAQGTSAAPIVFTSQRAAGVRKPGDWGGIIIIGNGIINRTGTILTEGPAGVAETYSGGVDNTDNSGTLRYVRIEYAGYDVSGGNASELNGLSLYAVGGGTTLEYVEILNGLDDSFEWWGGAVDGRYLVSYNSGDDHFDWSEGYVGRNQFLIGFQQVRLQPEPGTGTLSTDPQGFEADGCNGSGCTLGFRSTPFADPIFSNVTLVGMGANEITAAGGFGAVLRRGTKGRIANSIIANWKGTGLTVRDSVTGNILTADSLNVTDIVFAANAADYDPIGTNFGQATAFAADNHRTAASVAAIITSVTPTALNWIPLGTAASGCGTVAFPAGRTASYFGGTLAPTAYCGAQDPAAAQWTAGWTVYNEN
jgi:hypothetical protein